MRRNALLRWPRAAALLMCMLIGGTTVAQSAPRENYPQLLKQAYLAYQSGDYEAAMTGYEHVLADAHDPSDQVRALISLAMIRLLPDSKMHDIEAATIVLGELDRRIVKYKLQNEFFGDVQLLHLIEKKERETAKLRGDNAVLRKEIKRKEDTIRQLRAVTVDSG